MEPTSNKTMNKRFSPTLDFLQTTAIGGVLFLLPFAGVVFVLSYVYRIVLVVYKAIEKISPVHSTLGVAILFVLCLGLVVGACFFTGLIASRSIAKRSAAWVESHVLKVFPKYAIYKEILTGTLGGKIQARSLQPVRVKIQGITRLAFETNREADGTVAVYFPGAPDPWSGYLGWVSAEDVETLPLSFNDTVAQLEQLGRTRHTWKS
jgi:uncharacterized membrane protein